MCHDKCEIKGGAPFSASLMLAKRLVLVSSSARSREALRTRSNGVEVTSFDEAQRPVLIHLRRRKRGGLLCSGRGFAQFAASFFGDFPRRSNCPKRSLLVISMEEERPTKRAKRDHDRTAKGGVPQVHPPRLHKIPIQIASRYFVLLVDSDGVQANPFVEMLQATQVGDILASRKVVVLQSNETLKEAMQTLGRFKILSAPVLDSVVRLLIALFERDRSFSMGFCVFRFPAFIDCPILWLS